jgi:transposase
VLGTDRHQTRGRLPAHSRIHLFVRRGLSEGWDLRLSDHAEIGTACFQVFLNALSRKFARQDILLVLDGAPNHRCRDLVLPGNISLLFLPPYSPELNPKENLWKEIREKIFKNYALKSIDAVRTKLKQAILYIERNPKIVKSITSFPYIRKSF